MPPILGIALGLLSCANIEREGACLACLLRGA